MRVSFVKGEKVDRVYVERPDGTEASWTFPSYGPTGMPHDLEHFAVERALGMRDGIFGRVAAGADLKRINDAASRARGKIREKYAGLGDDVEAVLLSEALVSAPWRSPDADEAAVRDGVLEACGRFGVSPPEGLDVARVRAEVRALHRRWLETPAGKALVLTW